MQALEDVVLYGIDPGSSKSWASYRLITNEFPLFSNSPTFTDEPISSLDAFITRIVCDAKDRAVLLAIDAPICMPQSFGRPGANLKGAYWPFDLNPFSTRPCEKSLASKPTVMNSSLRFPEIAKAVGKLCCWEGEYRNPSNQSLTNIHPGLSVLGYQSAPHGPIVQLFRRRLEECAANAGVLLSYSPNEATKPNGRCIYVLESHPAVTMAIWIAQKRLGSIATLAKYKGDSSAATTNGFKVARDAVEDLFRSEFACMDSPVSSDDELDALVGLANLIDLLRGKSDWWGTEDSGYFLIPIAADSFGTWTVRKAWDNASESVNDSEVHSHV